MTSILLRCFGSYEPKIKNNKPKSQFIQASILPVHHHDELISDNCESKLPYNILSVCCSIQYVE